jgi:hypothetical protein
MKESENKRVREQRSRVLRFRAESQQYVGSFAHVSSNTGTMMAGVRLCRR